MYNPDEILIIGDSFCADREPRGWPQQVYCQLTGTEPGRKSIPRGAGFSGGSWWSVRKCLLNELKIKVPKVLILAHTEPHRIPNDDDVGINWVSAEHGGTSDSSGKKKKFSKDLISAVRMYYKHLVCFDFNEWATIQWFKELDEICKEHAIEKVIHMFCFEGPYTSHTFEHGVTISIPLVTHSDKPEREWIFTRKPLLNHYTFAKNKIFAENICELVNNFPGNNKRLDMNMVFKL